jgi:arylsulfatase A-like enzyme
MKPAIPLLAGLLSVVPAPAGTAARIPNVIVILTDDQGTLLEGGIRVPFIVSWPARLPAGKGYERPVSSLDFTATAISVAGLAKDASLDGVDLIPYLRGERAGDPHAALYWRFWGQTAVRAGDWKLVRLNHGETEMLYQLGEDLGERHNRASEQPGKAAELRGLLAQWESRMMPPKPRGGLNDQEKEWFHDQAGIKADAKDE